MRKDNIKLFKITNHSNLFPSLPSTCHDNKIIIPKNILEVFDFQYVARNGYTKIEVFKVKVTETKKMEESFKLKLQMTKFC